MVAFALGCEIASIGVHQQCIWIVLLKGYRDSPCFLLVSLKKSPGPNFALGVIITHYIYMIFSMYATRVRVDEHSVRTLTFLTS